MNFEGFQIYFHRLLIFFRTWCENHNTRQNSCARGKPIYSNAFIGAPDGEVVLNQNPWLSLIVVCDSVAQSHAYYFLFKHDTRYTEPRIEDRGSITNLMNRPASRVIFTFPSLVLRSRQTVGKYSVSTFIARFKADFTLNYAWKWHPLISICNSLESRKKEFSRRFN